MDNPALQFLAPYTRDKILTPGYGDSYLLFAGQDDIHALLLDLLHSETVGLIASEYAYDDDDYNNALLALMRNPTLSITLTLDLSQARLPDEHALLLADQNAVPNVWKSSVSIGESETGAINHTKARVFLSKKLYMEGSVNLSPTGEGTPAGKKGCRSQNNTLTISANPTNLARITAELLREHHTLRTSSKPSSIEDSAPTINPPTAPLTPAAANAAITTAAGTARLPRPKPDLPIYHRNTTNAAMQLAKSLLLTAMLTLTALAANIACTTTPLMLTDQAAITADKKAITAATTQPTSQPTLQTLNTKLTIDETQLATDTANANAATVTKITGVASSAVSAIPQPWAYLAGIAIIIGGQIATSLITHRTLTTTATQATAAANTHATVIQQLSTALASLIDRVPAPPSS